MICQPEITRPPAQAIPPAAAVEAALAHARAAGHRDGVNAAAWYLPASPGPETCARLLAGIDDGDPEILDQLPAPDLSGQWAGDPASDDLWLDACQAARLHPDGSDLRDLLYVEVCDAYAGAFTAAVQDEITRIAGYHAAGQPETGRPR